MNAKNLPLKFAFLGLIIALCVWSLLAKKLRLGIDLRGGHAMVFEISGFIRHVGEEQPKITGLWRPSD